MKLFRGFSGTDSYRGGYVAIGNFDGVHRGHQRILGTLVELARAEQAAALVLTFEPHPITLLAPGRVPPSLSALERKAELIARCGVDALVAYPTDRDLLNLSPEAFFQRIIRDQLDARGLVEGRNFCFGKDRAGDANTLRLLCGRDGLTLRIVDAVTMNGDVIVSSSAIRRAISEGRIADAVAMLGHPYRLTGHVETGARRGTGLGFPTANVGGVTTLLPPGGVYAGRSDVDGRQYAAAVHLGPNPTFDDGIRKLEVHLLDFTGDLYGKTLSVDLIDRVRDTMRFDDAESLRDQLERDVAIIRQRIAEQ